MHLPSKEDARLCAGVVREVARAKGIAEPFSIGRLTARVARLFNRGMRDRDSLLSEAMAVADMPVAYEEQGGALHALRNINPGTIDSSMEPKNERGHQQK
ncbi:hypothetical protein NE852_31775 (plasmid) [Rhizobium sp. Pop5]|uniref:hypothetical protein n=1 Tax=Rhizobium sp. Pop5 TaxID=1223565 RepID=UPI000283C42B|nr:hypothetical protein [Rhizobium sp. Pop5]EJZ18509.1 hypothetical protein RCCGEPOP_25292 [Rhizobium sp. Pop5]UVD60339.1 hypothetical protein NE852_31775 [Rhizobium sp. Pop5]